MAPNTLADACSMAAPGWPWHRLPPPPQLRDTVSCSSAVFLALFLSGLACGASCAHGHQPQCLGGFARSRLMLGEPGWWDLGWSTLMVAVCMIYTGLNMKQLKVFNSLCKLQCGPRFLAAFPSAAAEAAHSLRVCLVLVLVSI